MAGSKSDYLENKLLRHMAKLEVFAAPANWYLTLFTVAPTDAGGGTECAGGNYVRKLVAVDGVNFTVTASTLTTGADVLFLVQTAAIGTPVAWGIFDAASGGNLLWWGDLLVGDQKVYSINDQPIIPASTIAITED